MLRQVPTGRVTTYGELARAAGDLRLAAWIGAYLLDHPHSSDCPCHRVVRTGGEVGRYLSGLPGKVQRLREEGVPVINGKIPPGLPPMTASEFHSDAPLRKLQAFQETLAGRVKEIPLDGPPTLLCGLDVAYPTAKIARGAAVLIETATGELIWQESLETPAPFPYVPGYLTFRELPVLLKLWKAVAPRADTSTVCLVDGNGRLHPRRAGVAACFGVLIDRPTIGVSKSLLCGRVVADVPGDAGTASIMMDGDMLGKSLAGPADTRPVYVSVGQRITLHEAVDIVRSSRAAHRLPAPIAAADRLSKSGRR